MEKILDKAKNQLAQNLPFALYKKPNSNTITGLFQQNDNLFEAIDFTEKGFVFASFDGNKTVLIPENQSERISADFKKKESSILDNEFVLPNESTKNDFENLVLKGIQAIGNNEFKKVVLSRKESIDLANFDLINAFENLAQLYPTTFVYCFYHPKIGTWLGATPEQLLKANGGKFQTIALAGTQKDRGSNEVVWPKKSRKNNNLSRIISWKS